MSSLAKWCDECDSGMHPGHDDKSILHRNRSRFEKLSGLSVSGYLAGRNGKDQVYTFHTPKKALTFYGSITAEAFAKGVKLGKKMQKKQNKAIRA